MPYLLDTVTISEFRKRPNMDPAVYAWQESVRGERVWLSVITLNEIQYGILKVEKRDPALAERLRDWYSQILAAAPNVPFLDVDRAIAEQAAGYRALLGLSYNDSLIAATAKVHNLTLATRNIADFQNTGILLVNPWETNA